MIGTGKRFTLMFLLLSAGAFALTDATISGRVQDNAGKGQMGAVVEVYATASNSPVIRAYTDTRGSYILQGLLPGTYFVKATATQFLPSVREGVVVKAGSHVLLNLTLSTLIEAFQLLPSRKAEVKGDDDWRWTLRSSANRPILRVLEDDGPLVVVSKAESDSDRTLKAHVAFIAGSDGSSISGADTKTSFNVEQSMFGAGTMSFSGNLGYNTGVPNGVVRTSYRHKMADGSEPEMAITARRFASPDAVQHHAAMNALAMALVNHSTVSEFLEADYGGELQSVQFRGRVTAFRPFATLTAHVDDNTIVQYRYATSRPTTRNEKGFDTAPSDLTEADPRVSLQGSLPQVERASHHEVSVSRRLGNNNFQVAAFVDSFRDPALLGVGNASFFDSDVNTANFLPDVYSSTFTFTGRDFSSPGLRAVAQHRFGEMLTATVDYSFGGSLIARGHQLSADPQLFDTTRLHAATAKVSGTVPRAKTKWLASYKWTSRSDALMPVDMFNDSAGRSDPFLNVFIRQPLPIGNFIPAKMEMLVDVRNLLAQGYVPMWAPDGSALYLVQSARSLRGGLAFNF
jgi:hypothetical protein